MKRGWILLLGMLTPLAGFAANGISQPIERYAFIAASNDGGVGRAKLRYAETDALSLASVFEEIGGLESKNKTVLLSPNRTEFLNGLRRFRDRVRQGVLAEKSTQMLFYYSGHSNEHGLLLGDGLITYKDLRAALDEIPADVRVAILDSCQAGAFTRLKGGKRQPSFLMDDSKNIKGTVMLAASSENEAAQESDKIGASFFTHYLVSALRGAGDISGDKMVTLNEAYYYAFNETLARTEGTKQGAQHPAYDIQIAGAGDLVLTDVKQTTATLVVPSNIIGRLYIRDPSGRLVVELNKLVNNEIELALMPGEHQILLDQEGALYKQEVMVARDTRVVLAGDGFATIVGQKNRVRGDEGQVKEPSYFNWKLNKPNRFGLGIASDFVDYRDTQEIYQDEVSTDFRGYIVSYRRDVRRDFSFQFAFAETKATGVMRNFSITGLTSILGDEMNVKNGFRLYGGLGVLAFSLHGFPWQMTNGFRESGEKNYGLQVVLGIQYEFQEVFFDSVATFRHASISGQRPLEDSGWPVFSAQLGLRF